MMTEEFNHYLVLADVLEFYGFRDGAEVEEEVGDGAMTAPTPAG